MNEYIEMDDQLELIPLEGRKKKIDLKRTQFDFVSANKFTSGGFRIELPSLNGAFLFLLKLENHKFIFKSSDDTFFKYNGNWAREILLKPGDQIYFSGNILKFKKNISFQDQDNYEDIINSDLPLLIQGETGTGKTYLAKKLHEKSNRAGRFVHLNLSSFSKNLIESEIFGHKKGSFTGALNDRMGAIKQSSHGTLFLDEIDSLSKDLQVKLLLFLDNYSFRPVGALREEKCETRIMIASGQSLERMVRNKTMRKDFFFRISSGHQIELKPLRSNPKLIEEHCYQFCFENDLSLNHELLEFYKSYQWPGNFRQLYAHLEKKKALGQRCMSFDKYDELLIQCNIEVEQSGAEYMSLKELKERYIRQVYHSMSNDKKITARILKIHPKTVEKLLH